MAGNRSLARTSSLVAAAAVNVSPLLLVKDLGRPERFLNMLRVFKPTSPMSVGSWLLAATGTAQSAATTCELLDVLPRVGGGAQACAGLLGPALATYTGALLSDTAVPAWHEARRELPAVFAASSCASAGAAATLVGDVRATGPARRLGWWRRASWSAGWGCWVSLSDRVGRAGMRGWPGRRRQRAWRSPRWGAAVSGERARH